MFFFSIIYYNVVSKVIFRPVFLLLLIWGIYFEVESDIQFKKSPVIDFFSKNPSILSISINVSDYGISYPWLSATILRFRSAVWIIQQMSAMRLITTG